jgi:hypothetical protein
MKKLIKKYRLPIILVIISCLIYSIDFMIFKDSHAILRSIIEQLAFIPIYVLLVMLVIEGLLDRKEKEERAEKLNVVIGVFFDELGIGLLRSFSKADENFNNIRGNFMFTEETFLRNLPQTFKTMQNYTPLLKGQESDISSVKEYISKHKEFLISLMENPNLVEHELFTNAILSVFHIYEELSLQENIEVICKEDRKHIAQDCERAYMLLLEQWLYYMKHLEKNYPYLFSVEIRMNPFK